MTPRILLLLIPALFCAGCGDLLSLHALSTPQDRITDSAIEGRWENDKQILEVERSGDTYRAKLTPKNEPAEARDYTVQLADLGGVRFADVLWTEAIGHMIMRVRIADNQLHLAFFDSKWLRDRVPHEEADGNNGSHQAVWIAPTRQVRSVVAKYAQESRAYDNDELVYRRAAR